MFESTIKITSVYKESNKLVGSLNFFAWNRRIYLILIENEVIEYVKGSITKPSQEQAQALSKHMKGEIRVQRILIESIKDSLIPYVAKMETMKEIYEKLVEMFSISTSREVISLITKLYNINVFKDEGITSYLMMVSQIRDKLQELGEIMFDKGMTTVVLNALPNEWGNFVSSIYGNKEAIPFNELWS